VTDQQSQPVSGMTVTMEGSASGQTTTNGSGQLSFGNLQIGDYTLTPSLSGYVFTPSSITYLNLQRNRTDANFTAMPAIQTVFNKTVNYDYNSVGALSGVGTNLIGSDPNNTTNVLNSLTFRASGALSSLNYGNGRRLTMGYNANRQQPISMKVDRTSNPSDKIIDYAYDYYDANGKNNNRIRKITDNVDTAYTTDYSYDDYNRLTNAQAGAYFRFYYYDRWGNITNFSAVTHTYATNASGAPATNRISTVDWGGGPVNLSYDAAGNMTYDGAQSYSYDGAGRLKEAGTGGSNVYGYDGDGMRVRKVEGSLTLFYIRSSVQKEVAMEVTVSGVYRANVLGMGQVIAQQSYDGNFYWVHKNHIGSARAMTDVNGNLVYKGQFDPYGQTLLEWSSSGYLNQNSKKFTGYERDAATGLDYANARMYNSWRGRFMQPDPAGMSAANLQKPESLNRYSYTQNDPVNFVDRSGELTCYGWFLIENGSIIAFLGISYCISDPGDMSKEGGRDSRGGGDVGQEAEIQRRAKTFRDAIARVILRLATNESCRNLFNNLDNISSYLDNNMFLTTSKDFISETQLANFRPNIVDGKRTVGGIVD
jgi:RHS repeat-associated protein